MIAFFVSNNLIVKFLFLTLQENQPTMKKTLLSFSLLLCSVSQSQTLNLQSFATGFSSPVEITHAPNDSRLFVVQKGGLIRIVNTNGTVNSTPFLTVSGLSGGSEQGLLGLAFHPNYATNGLFFINYTNTAGDTVIARYSVSSTNPDVANPTGTILMTIDQPYSNHNGGTLKFGPDGYLYIGMGDGGSADDPQGYAQNMTVNPSFPSRIFLGKMLRIDVNSGTLYGIPPTNPYIGQAGIEEILARGLRNPWKFSFNRLNGDLWIADVGQNIIEEVNKIESPLSNSGLNFGWNCYEGNASYSSSGSCPLYAATVAPVSVYSHNSSRCSITGGYFYTGTAYPNFSGKYIFADYCTAEIAWIDNTGNITWAYDASGVITTFGEDKDGELYICNSTSIYKIIDTSLDVETFDNQSVKVFPNPAKNLVNITCANNPLQSITITDLLGKKVFFETVEPKLEYSINVSNLQKGIYFLEAENTTGKIVKTKLIIE
jgi:glucose/arabinose dehydrogenase